MTALGPRIKKLNCALTGNCSYSRNNGVGISRDAEPNGMLTLTMLKTSELLNHCDL